MENKASIKDVHERLLETASFLQNLNRSRVSISNYHSRMEQLVGQLEKKIKNATINRKVEGDIREDWNRLISSDDFSSLNVKLMRRLSSDSEIVTDIRFIQLVHRHPELITTRVITQLILVHHQLWKNNPQFVELDRLILSLLQAYEGKSHILNCWKANHLLLIGDNAASNLAKNMVDTDCSLEKKVSELCLLSSNSLFCKIALIERVFYLAKSISAKSNRSLWDRMFEELKVSSKLSKEITSEIFGHLINAANEVSDSIFRNELQDIIKTILLSHADYGDPRVNSVKWSLVPTKSKDQFISWLAEDDIQLFFELITNDKSKRDQFWIKYCKNAKNSKVFFNQSDLIMNRMRLKEFKNEGRRFGTINGDSSAFILIFDRYLVIEFAKQPNACYIYDIDVFTKRIGKWDAEDHTVKNLKRGNELNFVAERLSHTFGWEQDFISTLARLGIRHD